MHDFFDMQSLSAILQEVIEKLDGGNDDAAIDFTTHVFTTHVPCIATPLCTLYTEENAVIRYAQQFLKYNQELGIVDAVESLAHHTARFDYADTPMLTPESALSVLNRVCEMFPYAEKVIGDNPIEILLIESQHESRNGESTAIFTFNGMHGIICIYQLQGNCIAAPEHIFLHELGHLLHMRATGTITAVPASFIEYLSQLGTDCSELTTEQLQEVFADTFMLAVISQASAASAPLPQIAEEVKQKCFQYIGQLLRAIPNA